MDETEERWLPVRGYQGWYEVSSRGYVRSLPRATTKGKVLKVQISTKGYRTAGLSKYGKVRFHRVSNLVLEAFVSARPAGQQARHGPGGQLDDSLANLCWGTASQNQLDRRRDRTSNQGERSASSSLTEEIVLECRRRYAAGETQSALAAEFGVTSGCMSNAIRGRTWAHLTEDLPDPDADGRSRRTWTPERREQMREAGRKGAEKRWGSPSPG